MELEINHYEFYISMSRGRKVSDVIWVILDHLMKSTFFLPIKMTYLFDKLKMNPFFGASIRHNVDKNKS